MRTIAPTVNKFQARARPVPVQPDQLFLAHREDIDRAVRAVCHRHALYGADAEDFASALNVHLLDRDYRVLRRFQGRSSVRTFLMAVVAHFFQDWRNARWGKWRSSVEAKLIGPVAVRLEILVVRDGLPMEEAFEILRTNHGVTQSRAALERMVARFPQRSGRREVPLADGQDWPASDSRPDRTLDQRAAADDARRVAGALDVAFGALDAGDRLLLRMRFRDGVSIANIARTLQLEQKPLYRRFDRLLQTLRTALESAGLSRETALDVLGHRGFDQAAVEARSQAETRGDVRLMGGPAASQAADMRVE